jgi:hypothetical protein
MLEDCAGRSGAYWSANEVGGVHSVDTVTVQIRPKLVRWSRDLDAVPGSLADSDLH